MSVYVHVLRRLAVVMMAREHDGAGSQRRQTDDGVGDEDAVSTLIPVEERKGKGERKGCDPQSADHRGMFCSLGTKRVIRS